MKYIDRLLQPINTGMVSILGWYQLISGLWLLMPWTSLTRYSSIMPEIVLGVILTVIGGFITYGAVMFKIGTLKVGTTMGYLFWFVSMVFTIINTPLGIAWITCLSFAAYWLIVDINLRLNKGKSV